MAYLILSFGPETRHVQTEVERALFWEKTPRKGRVVRMGKVKVCTAARDEMEG
jgi:hypothetical protein